MSEQFSANHLLAGKLWLDRNFPDTTEVDIAYLKARFDMPAHAEAYVRQNWHKNNNQKKPFANSEIYQKSNPCSSSSESESESV